MKRKCKWIAAVLVLILCLTACGGEKAPAHCGTWTVSGISAQGVEFSEEQMQALGMNEVQDIRLVLTTDGKAYLTDGSQVEQGKWVRTDGGLQIGTTKITLQDNRLSFPFGEGVYLHLKKASDSQAAPKIATEKSTETTVPESTAPTVPETTAPTVPETTAPAEPVGIRPEFKAAMDAYEAFYDEYSAFMDNYKKNPTDLSLLSKYADMLTKVSEMDEKFNAWEKGEMSSEELKYYMDVNARVLKKLGDLF